MKKNPPIRLGKISDESDERLYFDGISVDGKYTYTLEEMGDAIAWLEREIEDERIGSFDLQRRLDISKRRSDRLRQYLNTFMRTYVRVSREPDDEN